MIFNKIWKRYFVWETLKTFFLFLVCFYGLYVLIDYATNASNFRRYGNFGWNEILFYYLYDFIQRASLIIPFAIMLATIRTLTLLNMHHELIALMANGVSLHTLLRPFIFIGLFLTLLMYANTQFVMPFALKELKRWDDARTLAKSKSSQIHSVQTLLLEDGSSVIFQKYDPSQGVFVDVYWICSPHEIFHCEALYPLEIPHGKKVDHFRRTAEGEIILQEHFLEKSFPSLAFNKKALFETLTTPAEQSLTELWDKLPQRIQNDKEAKLASTFYYKMVIPWFCLLATMGPIPFCIRFTRNLPLFTIYAGSIFSLVAFDILMNAAVVLGERQIFSPKELIFSPFLLFLGILSWRFFKIR